MKAEKVLFCSFALLLCCAPIPLGSNRTWAWSILEVGIFAVIAAWLALWCVGRAHLPPALTAARPAFFLLGAWLAEQAMHIVPLPAALVAFVSPESSRMQHLTDAIGVQRAWMTLSVDAYASGAAFLKSVAYAGIFFLALALVHSRSRLLGLARALVVVAVAISTCAVLMHLGNVRVEYLGVLLDHGGKSSGTFVNRNHFAGYLEMTLSIGIGLLVAGLTDRKANSWKRFVAHTIDWILSPRMILRLALCVLVIALTTTHSRMGNTAFFSALLLTGILGIALSRHAPRNTIILLASLVVIDLAIVGSWFGVERLAERIGQTTSADVQEREEPAAYTLGMIRDYPMFGAGPGSFYIVFPRYRPVTAPGFFDHAHNDYAEFAAESGILGLAILGAFVIVNLAAALKAQWLRRDPLMRGMSFACIMGVTSILIHSWVDFNLQIPSNAAYFMVLLALGWISLHMGRSDRGVREEPEAQ